MKISVIVPTRNRKQLLGDCITSLLNQNFEDYEILIVDDGSTDGTEEMFQNKDSRIRYIRTKKRGVSAARNVGISRANGKYIAFTDDDCILPADWLTIICENLSNHDVIAVGGPINNGVDKYIANASHMLQFSAWLDPKEKMVNNIPTANVAYARETIANHGFSETNEAYEDSLFNYKLTRNRKKILYSPNLKVFHNSCFENYGLKKFFGIQSRTASGFVHGGYIVHGRIGKLLIKYRVLNLLCPNLLYTSVKCIQNGLLLKFIYHLPLMLAGELYKGYRIIKS